MYVNAKAELVTLAPGLRPERRFAPLARGQRGRVVYEQIVDEGETRVDYLLIDNEAELSNCFSINHHIKSNWDA